MKWSYAEMAVTIEGLGLDWALDDLQDCIKKLVEMSGYPDPSNGTVALAFPEETHRAVPTEQVTVESAELLLSLGDRSVDALVFRPSLLR